MFQKACNAPLVNKPKIFDVPKCLALMKQLFQYYKYGDPRVELRARNCPTHTVYPAHSRGQKFETTENISIFLFNAIFKFIF